MSESHKTVREAVATELIAHGEFSTTNNNNYSHALLAADEVIKIVLAHTTNATLRTVAQPSPQCVVCGSGDTMTICEGCWTRQPAQAVDRCSVLREALTLGRDAVMESFDHIKGNDDQLMADARLQSIDAAIAVLASPAQSSWQPDGLRARCEDFKANHDMGYSADDLIAFVLTQVEQIDRLPTHGNLLEDINKAAHAAGTSALVREVLKRAHRAIRLSGPLTSTEPLPPDWKQDQVETSRLAPRLSSTDRDGK